MAQNEQQQQRRAAAAAAAEDPEALFCRREKIGQGGFGEVFRGVRRAPAPRQAVAIKIIDLEQVLEEIEDIRQEITVLAQCDCPHVTKYYGSYLKGPKLWIVMEYLGGGSAWDLLKAVRFEELHIAIVLRDVLRGLDYLHSERKLHRDIKAANILLSEAGEVKLADFGVAGQLTHTTGKRNSLVGTPFWMAPEVIRRSAYDFKADIWSLGITAMELATGRAPRSDLHPMRVLLLIPRSHPPQLGAGHGRPLRAVVEACLNKDPADRPTARELLKFPFIRKAKKNSLLIDLIQRYKRWKDGAPGSLPDPEASSDSEESRGEDSWQTWRWDLGTLQAPDTLDVKVRPRPDDGPSPWQPAPDPPAAPRWNPQQPRPFSLPWSPEEQRHWILLSDSDFVDRDPKSGPEVPAETETAPAPPGSSYAALAGILDELRAAWGAEAGGGLRGAFAAAEAACPGLADSFVREVLRRLVPGLRGQRRMRTAMDRLRGNNS